jgi:low affinity Fe/Cu permease
MSQTPLDLVVPIVMYCAMLWWIGRRFSWTQRLIVTVVTLTLILIVVLVERG